jgi:hypothetical protein
MVAVMVAVAEFLAPPAMLKLTVLTAKAVTRSWSSQ